MKRLCWVLAIVLIGVLLFGVMGCGRISALRSVSSNASEEIRFVPFRYCFDTFGLKREVVSFVFYSNTKTPSLINRREIQDASIKIGRASLRCTVKSVHVQAANEIRTRDGIFYPGSLTLRISTVGPVDLANAELTYRLEGSERQYRYLLGSMGVAEARANTGGAIDYSYIEAAAHSVGDAPVVSDVMLQCGVAEPIEIKNISFGFDDVGVDVKNIRVFSAGEYRRSIQQAARHSRLNEVIPTAYRERVVEHSVGDCSIKLAPGDYYLYVPLTKQSSADFDSIQMAANIHYVTQGGTKEQSSWVSSWPLFELLSWDVRTFTNDVLGPRRRQ